MRKIFFSLFLFLVTESASAVVLCSGKISNIYKWNYMTTISVTIVGADGKASPWISLPTKSDESMAMMAFAADKPVVFYWNTATITSCVDGTAGTWSHNTGLDGYFTVTK